jgi:hypothetical protein
VWDAQADLDRLEIEEYPTMGLRGALRNRRSDIGIVSATGPRLWIEAKTVVVPARVLHDQLVHEETALRNPAGKLAGNVVALVPRQQAHPNWPCIHWGDVADSLTLCVQSLQSSSLGGDVCRGYILLAEELRNRIMSHESKLVA